jgi:methionine biosynthesis protein MetW
MKYHSCIDLNNNNNTHTMILSSIEKNSKVLDIGCAQGYLGEYLNKEKECEVVGVDFLQSHIEQASQKKIYKELFCLDLNLLSDEMNHYTEYFDFILLADVLEHLYEPQKLLNQLKKILKPNGCFIVSIPNISHGSILINLIKNKFEYTPTGLLDDSHIRFFTLDSFVNILNKENLEIISLNASLALPTETEQKADLNYIPYNIVKSLAKNSQIFCYQYVLIVKQNENIESCKNKNNESVKKFNKKIEISVKPLKKVFAGHPLVKFIKYPRASFIKLLNLDKIK